MAVLILMVKHPSGTMAIRPSNTWKFRDFTNYFRGRLTQPQSPTLNFNFTYDISSYENCDLNNDDDWDNLILLTQMFEKQIVDVRCVFDNNCLIDDDQDNNILENGTSVNETSSRSVDSRKKLCSTAVISSENLVDSLQQKDVSCNVDSRKKPRGIDVTSSENLIDSPQQKGVCSGDKHNEVVLKGCANESRKKPRGTAAKSSENLVDSPQQKGVSSKDKNNEVVLAGCNNESRKKPRLTVSTSENHIVSEDQVDVSGGEEHGVVVLGCCNTESSMKPCRTAAISSENPIDYPQQKDVSSKHNELVLEGCNEESRKKPRITASTSEDVSGGEEHNVVVSGCCTCNAESSMIPQNVSPQHKDVSCLQEGGEEHIEVDLDGCIIESRKKPRVTESTSENPVDSAQQKDVDGQNVVVSGGCDIESSMKPCRTVTPSEYPNVSSLHGGEEHNEVESSEKTTNENQIVSLRQKMNLCYRLAEWENNITHFGQEFDGGVAEFRTKLVQYAAARGFHYNYVRNDGAYVTAVCGGKKSAGCKWYVNGAQNAATRSFILKKGDLKHTCTLSVKSGMKRMGAHVIADMIQEIIRLDPTICPSKVKKDLLDHYGFDFHYSQVWRGVGVARVNIFGTYQDSCDELRWCSEAIKKSNPGSEVFLEFHPETRKFTRFFVAFKACIEGFKCCRPMLFVDGTFTETRYKGTMLSATAKDGNNGLYPVAFAIVDQENESNWIWFIEKLRDTLHHEQDVKYVSKCAGGLISAFNQVFEKPLHFFCLYNLMKNLHTVYKGRAYTDFFRNRMCELLKEVAYAPSITLFEIALVKFKNKGGEIAEHFLMDLPFEKWTVAFNPDVLRYGELTSDATESFDDWILQAKCLPVTYMIDCIRTQIMGWYVDRREICSKWTGTLTPKMEEQWNIDTELSNSWMIIKAPAGDYEVFSSPPVTVDLNAHTCSCYKWQMQGFPCCHAIVVINRECINITGVVDPCFFLSTYKLCYQFDISPVPIAEKFEFKDLHKEDTIFPPVMKLSRGRGKRKTVMVKATEDEVEKRFLCGRCGKYGNHYWTTCEEAIE